MQKVYTATANQEKTILLAFKSLPDEWISPCYEMQQDPFFVGISAPTITYDLNKHKLFEVKNLRELREEGKSDRQGYGNIKFYKLKKGTKIEVQNNKIVVYRPRFIERFFKFNK